MTKPAITKRVTKGSALTYSELDTNFQNLADATLTVSDGTNSKALNLNDTLTFTAGSNITIGVNSSTGAITITGTGSGTINSGAAGALSYYPSAGITLDDTGLRYLLDAGNSTDIIHSETIQLAGKLGSGSPNAKVTCRSSDGYVFVQGQNIEFAADNGTNASTFAISSRNSNGVSINNIGASAIADLTVGNSSHSDLYGYNGLVLSGSLIDKLNSNTLETPSIELGSNYGPGLGFPIADITMAVPNGTIKLDIPTFGNNNGSPTTFDVNGSAYTHDTNGYIDFNNFSGFIFAHRQGTSIGMWLCSGNTVTSLGATTAGIVSYQSVLNGYRWSNNTGSTITVTMFSVKMGNNS